MPLEARAFARLWCGVLASRSVRFAVLASGNGSNLEVLASAADRGALGGAIVAVLSDVPGAFATERARRRGIEVVTPPTGRFRTRIEDELPWLEALRSRDVQVVLCAGFMRRLHATLLVPYAGRMLNIHPSLLPSFAGRDGIGDALAHGVRVTGCTVHLVEEAIDSGPIVAQAAVEVRDDDSRMSLTERIRAAEHELFPEAVRRYVSEPWRLEGRRIVFGEGPGLVLESNREATHG